MLKAFKFAFYTSLFIALIMELSSDTFSTVVNYWFFDLSATTKGVVVKSEKYWPGSRHSTVSYYIAYDYRVDNVPYRNDRVVLGKSDESPFVILKRYPVGKEVTIYYSPSKPRFSVLENTGLSGNVYFKLYGLLVYFLFVFIGLARGFAKYKNG